MKVLSRGTFLGLAAKGGATLALGGAAVGALAGRAVAAPAADGPLAELDLALARMTVAAELLSVEFYTRAIASKQLKGGAAKATSRALFNEAEHLLAMSEILTGAGQTASTADDFTFAFPDGTFDSVESIAKVGLDLETLSLQAYLGAVDAFAAPDLKTTAARIAANEAQHQSLFAGLAGGRPVGVSFPLAVDYATVSDQLNAYLG